MKDFAATVIGGTIIALGIAALILVGSIWGGFVLATLWNWYAAPFTAVRLTIPMAIGLSCLIAAIKGVRYRKTPEDEGGNEIVYSLIAPALLLLVGWVAHHYV